MNNNFDDETILHAMDVEDLIGAATSDDDVLEHWGIPGMRWGIRKYRNKDGTLTEAGKKRYLELEEKQNKLRAEQGKLETGKDPTIDVSRDKNGKKITKNHKNMSDEELIQRTARLHLESAYLDAATDRNAREAKHKTIEKTKEMQAEIAYKEAYNKLHPKKESAIKKFFEKNGDALIKGGFDLAKEYLKTLGVDNDEDEKKQKPEPAKKQPKPDDGEDGKNGKNGKDGKDGNGQKEKGMQPTKPGNNDRNDDGNGGRENPPKESPERNEPDDRYDRGNDSGSSERNRDSDGVRGLPAPRTKADSDEPKGLPEPAKRLPWREEPDEPKALPDSQKALPEPQKALPEPPKALPEPQKRLPWNDEPEEPKQLPAPSNLLPWKDGYEDSEEVPEQVSKGRSFIAGLLGFGPKNEATESKERQERANKREEAQKEYDFLKHRADALREQLARAERAGRYAEKQTINRELTPILTQMKRRKQEAKREGYYIG